MESLGWVGGLLIASPENGEILPQITYSLFLGLERAWGPFPPTLSLRVYRYRRFPRSTWTLPDGRKGSPPLTTGCLRTNLTDSHREVSNLKAKLTDFPVGIPILGPWGNTPLLPSPTDSLCILPSPHTQPPGSSSVPPFTSLFLRVVRSGLRAGVTTV